MKTKLFTFTSDTHKGTDTEVFTTTEQLRAAIIAAAKASDNPEIAEQLAPHQMDSEEWDTIIGDWKDSESHTCNYYQWHEHEIDLALPDVRVLITMEGGLVQHVTADQPARVLVIDYDTDGAQPETTMAIPQDDGRNVPACVESYAIGNDGAAAARIAELFTLTNS